MISRLEFSIDIGAKPSKIWKTLWDKNSYCQWASVFFKGSYVVANDWNKGSKVHFLGSDQNGIYSSIEKHIPNKIITFKHIGSVAEGKEQPLNDESKKWTGATETYMLIEGNNINTLKVEIDVMDEHLEFMTNTFPKALEKIKDSSTQ